MRDLVFYESLLERETIMLADFDPEVVMIVSQPFRISTIVGGKRKVHTPDYAELLAGGQIVVVNCKPADLASTPEILELHDWVSRTLRQAGISHRVVTEMPPQRAINFSSISHMRNPRWSAHLPVDVVAAACVKPMSVDDLVSAVATDIAGPIALACVRKLLWTRALKTDLDVALTGATIVEASVG